MTLQDDSSVFEGNSVYEYFKYNKISSLNIQLCESWNQKGLFCMRNSQRSVSWEIQTQKFFHCYMILKSEYNSKKQRTQYLVISVSYLVRFHRTTFPQQMPHALHSDSSRDHVVTYPSTICMLEKCLSLFLERANIWLDSKSTANVYNS